VSRGFFPAIFFANPEINANGLRTRENN